VRLFSPVVKLFIRERKEGAKNIAHSDLSEESAVLKKSLPYRFRQKKDESRFKEYFTLSLSLE